jgi:8-oxo-dGTP pyrophosphatase MutT (NUDIX family)
MHRNQLLELLESYTPFDHTEAKFHQEIKTFVEAQPACFERTLQTGHITGSAWIVDSTRQYTLLTHHHKLDKWFQTGGHCDGDPDVLAVALKEAEEETGLQNLKVVSSQIFDIDIHLIPERKNEPAHYHYDVRFLIEADKNEVFTITSESKDLAWVLLDNVESLNNSDSIIRMVKKTNP